MQIRRENRAEGNMSLDRSLIALTPCGKCPENCRPIFFSPTWPDTYAYGVVKQLGVSRGVTMGLPRCLQVAIELSALMSLTFWFPLKIIEDCHKSPKQSKLHPPISEAYGIVKLPCTEWGWTPKQVSLVR